MQGHSGFLTPERAAELMAEKQDDLTVKYPAVSVDGHLVHVFEEDGHWCVWLNTEDMEFTGLCIGVGSTRDLALAQAVGVCEAVAAHLQGPPQV